MLVAALLEMPLSRFLLLLASCHVFEEISVECTSDERCAKAGDADTDLDTDTDTDTDTGEPAGEPTIGWTISLVGGSNGRIRVYEPVEQEIVAEWAGFGTIGGAAYYEPSTGLGTLISTDELILLQADGATASAGSGLSSNNWDIARLGEKGVLALSGGVFEFTAELDRTKELIPQGTFSSIDHIGGGPDLAYFSDSASGGPDLYSLTADKTYTMLAQDYDSSTTRGVNVFVGPEGQAFACSTAGAVYAVNDLAGGNRSPYAYYDGSLDDVEKCDWDASSLQFLLYSPSKGIFRMNDEGDAEQVFSPPNGYTLYRAYFYEAG
jgi:hypothetical protein